MGERFSTGELAKRGQTTLRTIRYYESEGLLPSVRTGGGHRVFGEDALVRLALIKDLRSLDFSIDQIRVLLDNWAGARRPGDKGPDDRRGVLTGIAGDLERKLSETEARLRLLQRVHHELIAALQVFKGCGPCAETLGGPVCPTCHTVVDRPRSGLVDVLFELAGGGDQALVQLGARSRKDRSRR
ncbi:MAG: MerR family transcriptional regulator [Deltaproteobacteria bacterium]|nr:MerR family transcriptional regulator [Deltaproteobacteria bacterium]